MSHVSYHLLKMGRDLCCPSKIWFLFAIHFVSCLYSHVPLLLVPFHVFFYSWCFTFYSLIFFPALVIFSTTNLTHVCHFSLLVDSGDKSSMKCCFFFLKNTYINSYKTSTNIYTIVTINFYILLLTIRKERIGGRHG